MSDNLTLIPNYMYLYHTEQWIVLPTWPETIQDKLSSTFAQTTALSRTAPVFTYSYSGPRNIQVSLDLHRDLINEVNYQASNMVVEEDEDYVDALIRQIQAIALPRYQASSKAVVPPMVAIRFGNEIFIKGVITSGINITYQKPILVNNKYAKVQISFDISEVDPYDADSVQVLGSFRGITSTFKEGIYK